MIVHVYVIVFPDADRPYVSTTPPCQKRLNWIRCAEGEVYEAELYVPGEARPVQLDPVPLKRLTETVEEGA